MRALQQPPNAAHAERAISKQAPPSLYAVPENSTRAGAAPYAPGGARHGGGNRAVTSQPRMGQSTSYGDVKSAYGRAGGTGVDAQKGHPGAPGGGATQTHRTREPHQEGRGRAQQARRSAGRRSKAREATRTGNQNGGDGRACAWEAATTKGMAWPTLAQPASGGGCLRQPRWAVCATGAGAHQGQISRQGERDIWWTIGATRGGAGHLGLTHTETQRGRLWTACGQRRVDSKNSQTTSATTSTTSIRQLCIPGAADAQTAHHATSSTAPAHQPLGSASAETTPARAPAAAADRNQQPDATCEGKNG